MIKIEDDLRDLATAAERHEIARLMGAARTGADASLGLRRIRERLRKRRERGGAPVEPDLAEVDEPSTSSSDEEDVTARLPEITALRLLEAIERGDRTIALAPGVEAIMADGRLVTLTFGISGLTAAQIVEGGADGQVIKRPASADNLRAFDQAIKARWR